MGIYNKGYTFVREFQTIEEINEFCMRNHCEPLDITPFVVKDNYKAGGSTSAVTSIIHEHHYAVILRPFKSEDSCESELDKFDKNQRFVKTDAARGWKTQKVFDSVQPKRVDEATKLKSNKPQNTKASQVEKEFGQTFSVTDILKQEKPVDEKSLNNDDKLTGSKTGKTLNNVRYTDIADVLHYSDKQKQLSKRWFETHPKDKPFDSYVTYMELQPWQVDILDVMI